MVVGTSVKYVDPFDHTVILADENRSDNGVCSTFTERTRIIIVGVLSLLKLIALVIIHYYHFFGTPDFVETSAESRLESSYNSWIPITTPIVTVIEFFFTIMLFVVAKMDDRPELLLPWLASHPLTSVFFTGTFLWINVNEHNGIKPRRTRNVFAAMTMLAIASYGWYIIFNVYRRLRNKETGKMSYSNLQVSEIPLPVIL